MAIRFILNDRETSWEGDDTVSLLAYLRDHEGITSVKDGCSGQGACGACLLEVNGKPVLSCRTPMRKVDQARVVTIEGFEPEIRLVLGRAFVDAGAVQCGFCTPGFLARARLLLKENPMPSRDGYRSAFFHRRHATGRDARFQRGEPIDQVMAASAHLVEAVR